MKLSYPVCTPDATEKIMAWCGDYEEAFSFLRNTGYAGIELLVKDPAAVDREELKRLLAENGLSLSAVGTTPMQKEDHLFLMDPDPEIRREAAERLFGLIDLAAEFEAPVLIGKYRGTAKDADGCRLEDLAEVLKKADEEAGRRGTLLFIEPQNASNINNLNTIGETVSWIRENHFKNVMLLMDLFHMDQTEESITGSLKTYAAYLGMVHMADSGRKIPGTGSLPMKEILNTLYGIGYKGYLSMEIKQEPDERTAAVGAAGVLK